MLWDGPTDTNVRLLGLLYQGSRVMFLRAVSATGGRGWEDENHRDAGLA